MPESMSPCAFSGSPMMFLNRLSERSGICPCFISPVRLFKYNESPLSFNNSAPGIPRICFDNDSFSK